METYEKLFLNAILIFFPLLCYLVYMAYNYKVKEREKELFLDFALLTSLYLSFRFGVNMVGEGVLIIFNIPLFLAYFKKRKMVAILMSLIIAEYYVDELTIYTIYILIEYLLYYVLAKYFSNNGKMFILYALSIKSIIYLMYTFSIHSDLIVASFMVASLWVVAELILFLFWKAEDVMRIQMAYKEIGQDEQIRTSLFKITHEIKNPIAVCKGYLEMFDVNNKEHSKKYIPIMREEIARLLVLLEDFLCMNKIKLNKDILDINMLIEDVTDNLSFIIDENNIKFISGLEEDEIYINGDYNRLVQVFVNLIKNSIEAKKGDNSYIKIKTKKNKKFVEIKIIDNGTGIDDDTLKKMTEPFFTTKMRGTGLGVSLSYEIIEGHEGTIKYDSLYGKGTTVTVKIPLYEYRVL